MAVLCRMFITDPGQMPLNFPHYIVAGQGSQGKKPLRLSSSICRTITPASVTTLLGCPSRHHKLTLWRSLSGGGDGGGGGGGGRGGLGGDGGDGGDGGGLRGDGNDGGNGGGAVGKKQKEHVQQAQ